jgi:hypothetical protein
VAKQANLINKLHRIARAGILSLVFFSLAGILIGCCPYSRLEADYGAAVTYNETVQIARPEAGLDYSPAVGLSPEAAVKTMEAYNKSFERKVQQKAPYASFINMGVSSQ